MYFVPVIMITAIFVGCGPANIAVKPEFWQLKNTTIGVAIVKYPVPQTYRAGSQGLLDMAINSAAASTLDSYLQKLDLKNFSAVADTFVSKLRQRGFTAKRIEGIVDPEKMPAFSSARSDEKTMDKDFRQLGRQEGVERLILLAIDRCGTIRNYYGFIPLGAPKAFCLCKGHMVNCTSNTIEWFAATEELTSTVDVIGDWDQPPAYPNLTQAFPKAMESGIQFLEKDYFDKSK